jgi:hypothetical protein
VWLNGTAVFSAVVLFWDVELDIGSELTGFSCFSHPLKTNPAIKKIIKARTVICQLFLPIPTILFVFCRRKNFSVKRINDIISLKTAIDNNLRTQGSGSEFRSPVPAFYAILQAS